MADKRRLPVVKPTPEEEQGEPPRPPWHWVGFGCAATLAAWMPLAYGAEALRRKLIARFIDVSTFATEADLAAALGSFRGIDRTRLWAIALGLPTAAMCLGSLAGGYLVGRFGGEQTTTREATLGGFSAAIIVSVLAAVTSGSVSIAPLVIVVIATAMAYLGGRFGYAKRIRDFTPNMNR